MSGKAHKIHLKWSAFIGYEEWDNKKVPEKEKGVYEYFVRLKNDGRKMIYVGEADDLRERSEQHVGENETNKCLKEKLEKKAWDFRYALVPLKADRQDAELVLYNKHKPECNINEPSGSGRNLQIELEEE
jgi:excinuclease UvrABC nuclease subunit